MMHVWSGRVPTGVIGANIGLVSFYLVSVVGNLWGFIWS